MKKVNFETVTWSIDKFIYEEKDNDTVTYWFNKKSKKFVCLPELERIYGEYNTDIFLNNNWILVDNIDVLQRQKEFINNSGHTDLIESIKGLEGEELQYALNMIFHDYYKLAEKWSKIHYEDIVKTSINWLENNNIPYRIDRKLKKELKSRSIEL